MRSSVNKVRILVIPALSYHDCRHTAASIMLSHGIPPIIVAYAHYIPGTQDEAARVMDDILTPIPIDFRDLRRDKS
jgi:hypothetical protein